VIFCWAWIASGVFKFLAFETINTFARRILKVLVLFATVSWSVVAATKLQRPPPDSLSNSESDIGTKKLAVLQCSAERSTRLIKTSEDLDSQSHGANWTLMEKF
jgi:hypothetical protein